jgi:hypothetical protein
MSREGFISFFAEAICEKYFKQFDRAAMLGFLAPVFASDDNLFNADTFSFLLSSSSSGSRDAPVFLNGWQESSDAEAAKALMAHFYEKLKSISPRAVLAPELFAAVVGNNLVPLWVSAMLEQKRQEKVSQNYREIALTERNRVADPEDLTRRILFLLRKEVEKEIPSVDSDDPNERSLRGESESRSTVGDEKSRTLFSHFINLILTQPGYDITSRICYAPEEGDAEAIFVGCLLTEEYMCDCRRSGNLFKRKTKMYEIKNGKARFVSGGNLKNNIHKCCDSAQYHHNKDRKFASPVVTCKRARERSIDSRSPPSRRRIFR